MRWFQTTTEAVARNPIARAVAKQRLAASIRDQVIKFYLTPAGEPVPADAQETAQVIMTAIQILIWRDEDDPVMRAAISTLAQCAEDKFRWKPLYAVTVDVALQRALEVYRHASAEETRRAYKVVQKAEQECLTSLQPA